MSEAADWSWLRTSIPVIDMAMYLDMPEDVSRTVEIHDGMIVHCESASPNHVAVSVNLQVALREALAKRPADAPCLRASGELDMLVSEVPFHYKRPDVILYRCIEQPRGRWKTKPMASDTLLVVEVVSPNTITADLVEKRGEYAHVGIPYYWIVRMVREDGPVASIEMLRLTTDGTYVREGLSLRARGDALAVDVADPIEVTISWDRLDLGLD